MHRDLKPANIKITPQRPGEGAGLRIGESFRRRGSRSQPVQFADAEPWATNAGMILGTAAYMSPEQAKGKETDRSCDIWAFGCVFYSRC